MNHTIPPLTPLEPRVGCIAGAMRIMGSKWTALIIKDLLDSPRRFNQIETSVKGINPRTLSQRLEDLVAHEILIKKSYTEAPPRCEYSLTTKGHDLLPILQQMAAWGDKYYADSDLKSSDTELIQ